MRHLDFTSCPADPDLWMRPAKKADGSECWEHILLCVDDALAIGETPERTLQNELGRHFELKEESIGPPKTCLGGKVRKAQLQNGVWCWGRSSSQHVQAAVQNVEAWLEKDGNKRAWGSLPRVHCPLPTTY